MKRASWAWIWTKSGSEAALYFSLWLIGLPAALYILFLLLRPPAMEPPAPLAQVQRWVEPLQGYAYTQVGFAAMLRHTPDLASVPWETVLLPDFIPLPKISQLSDRPALARAWFRIHITPPADLTPATNWPYISAASWVGPIPYGWMVNSSTPAWTTGACSGTSRCSSNCPAPAPSPSGP